MHTFQDLIARWPSVAEFAREIDVQYQTARKMNDRNNIHSEHWEVVLGAARARGIRVSADDLLRMSRVRRDARKKDEGSDSPKSAAA